MPEAPSPLYEVFIRAKAGLSHKHVGSLHALDDDLALQMARDVYARRGEGVSIWVLALSRTALSISRPWIRRFSAARKE